MRIAIVTPWYGPELIGGAEQLGRELAAALARAGAQIDIVTTTSRSFASDWGANYYRAGVRSADGLTVRRFKVDSRDRAAFSRANAKLVSLPRISLRRDAVPLPERDTRAFFADNINSSDLIEHLRGNGADYDAVVFIPYLYGPTIAGLPAVAERAFIIPCLHDEAYAYLEPVRTAVGRARGLLFNSAGEAEVAGAIFGPAVFAKSAVIGHAVDMVAPPRVPITIGTFSPHRSRYVLYLGRQDATKNVDFLLEAFTRFRSERIATSLQLVLAGPRTGALPARDGVIYLGPVAEDAKAALLTYARALAQPSLNESFSRAIYESWSAQRPVIVHGQCRATTRAVENSGGGWIATSAEDWVRVLGEVDTAANDAVDELGRRGWVEAVENGSWDAVALRTLAAISARLRGPAHGLRVVQIAPLGHASVNAYATALGSALRLSGADVSTAIGAAVPEPDADTILVHAVDATPPAPHAAAIVAHTSDIFTAPGMPPVFTPDLAVLQQLSGRGIAARLLPEPVDPGSWAAWPQIGERLDGGRTTIVSIAPLDSIDDARRIVEMLVALMRNVGNVRLVLLPDTCSPAARACFERERTELDLGDTLVLLASGRHHAYAALRAADVAIAFGAPLPHVRDAVDLLWFDVPIVAFDDPIVREAVEPCGIVADARDPIELAAVLKLVIGDAAVRTAMIAQGRKIRARYAPEAVVGSLIEAIGTPADRAPAGRRAHASGDPVS